MIRHRTIPGETPSSRKETGVRPSDFRAFTLVEIVLALGVISFAVVALVGLMAISLGSSRDSAEDTDIASMARQVTADLQAQKFDKLQPAYDYYFDNEAHRLSTDLGAIYHCKAILTTDPDPTAQADGKAPPNPNLYKVRLEFTALFKATPRSRSTTPPPSVTISSALARYD